MALTDSAIDCQSPFSSSASISTTRDSVPTCFLTFSSVYRFFFFLILLSLNIGEEKDDDYEKAQMESVHYLLEEPKQNKTYL